MAGHVSVADLKLALPLSAEKLINASGVGRVRQDGLNVFFKGTTAKAAYSVRTTRHHNGGVNEEYTATIVYPFMADDAYLTRGEADRLTGYTIHEAGHVLFTDTNVFRAFAARGTFHKMILNGIEDARMEREVIRTGFSGGSRRCLEVLASSVVIRAINEGYNPNESNNLAFTLAILGRDVCGIKVSGVDKVWAALNGKNRVWMEAACKRIAALPGGRAGTADAAALAQDLIDSLPKQPTLPQQPDQPAPQPEQQEEQQSLPDPEEQAQDIAESDEELSQPPEQDGAGGEDDSVPFDDSEDDPEQADADDNHGEDGEDGDASGDAAGEEGDAEQDGESKSESDSSGSSADAGNGFSLGDVQNDKIRDPEVNGEIAKLAEKHVGEERDKASQHFGDSYVAPKVKPRARKEFTSTREYSKVKNSVRGVGTIKSKLAQILQCPDEAGWDNLKTSGRLDKTRFAALASGSESVFDRRWVQEGYECAVTVLIDLSGSMSGTNIMAARTVAVTFAEIFESLGISFEVCGFTDSGNYDGDYTRKDESSFDSHHSVATEAAAQLASGSEANLHVFKPRDGNLRHYRQSLYDIVMAARGGTPDYAALRGVVEQMSKLPHRRKVVFNITDGVGCGAEAIKSVVKMGKPKNVDVIGVGIGRMDVTGQYDLSINVKNPNDLGSECFKGLLEMFEKYQASLGREVL